MTIDEHLQQLINQTPFLNQGDKSFLLEKIVQMSPLEKLKLQGSLVSGHAPAILQSLQVTRAKFFQKETPKKPDIITKISNAILGTKPKTIVSKSILTQPQVLGGAAPQSIRGEKVRELLTLEDFYHPAQLSQLTSKHVTFGINANTEQIIQKFLDVVHDTFESIDNINLKRAYFMNFVESPLFVSYINTALTALRHPELQPAKIILNLLYQINTNYLNNKQFQFAAIISNHLRNVCGI